MTESGVATPRADNLVAKLIAAARRGWADALFVLLSVALLNTVVREAFTIRVSTFSSTSDYWEHAAALRALIEDPLSPENPHLVSDASSPRFGPHFVLIALLARALDFDAIQAMSLAAVINVALLLIGIACFFRAYHRSRLAPLFALFVMLGSWRDAPHFSNVYQLSILYSVASYPSTAALGVSWLGFALTLQALRSAPSRLKYALLVVLWAYLFATHQLTAAFGLSGALLLALTADAPRRTRLIFLALPLLGVALAALWPYYSTLSVIFHGTAENVAQNLEGGPADTPRRFLGSRSLFALVGAATLGLAAFPYFIRARRLFVVLGFAVMATLAVAAQYVPIPLGHRFLLFAIFYLQVATVWVLLFLVGEAEVKNPLSFRGARIVGWVAVAGVLAYCTFPNVSRARERLVDRAKLSPPAKLARRVARLAGPNAVVLADRRTSWALPAYGPKVIALHHENPLVRDSAKRLRDVEAFYSPATTSHERARILRKYRVTAVIVGSESEFVEPFLRRRARRYSLPRGFTLYVF